MSDISFNAYATQAQLKKAASTGASNEAQSPDANAVAKGGSEFKAALQEAEATALQTAVTGADPHAMVQALANAELVLETAVTVRNKVVEAYQELLRMPV